MKRYKAYVLNLDSAPERWAHMQKEFQGTLLDLVRVPAISHKDGWIGCGETYAKLIREHMNHDPDFSKGLLLVLEDDLVRKESVQRFNQRCTEYFEYLEANRGTYSHFQGGGIYPSGLSLESRNPLLLRCDYITCLSFTVFQKDAAKSVLEWETTKDGPLDNYLANHNRGKMLAPYPHLVWQHRSLRSQIGDSAYKQKINNAFLDAKKKLSAFVKRALQKKQRTRRRKPRFNDV